MSHHIARLLMILGGLVLLIAIVRLAPTGEAEAQTTADQRAVALTECKLADGTMSPGVTGDIYTVGGVLLVCGVPSHFDNVEYSIMRAYVERRASATGNGYCRSRITGNFGAGGNYGSKRIYYTDGDHFSTLLKPSVSGLASGWWSVQCEFPGGDGQISYKLFGLVIDENA